MSHFKHGFTKNRDSPKPSIYVSWISMKQRCYNPNDSRYKDYGGRGIKVCDRWLESFQSFLDDMGPCPKGYSLERVDNNGNYTPENCKWATKKEQSINKRNNRWLEFNGKRMIIADWAKEIGLSISSIRNRLKNPKWSLEEVLTVPRRKIRKCYSKYKKGE